MSFQLSRTLKFGMRGEDVRVLQNTLIVLGYKPGVPDGIFGPQTRSAVTAFQKNFGLTQSGVVGPVTAAALNRALTEPVVLTLGSRGPEVAKVQSVLKDLGYDPGPLDGIYGPKTKAAIMAFQKEYGLVQDGIAGSETFFALNKAIR